MLAVILYLPSVYLALADVPNSISTTELLNMACAVLSRSVTSNSLQPLGLEPARLLCSWGFSRQEYWNGLPCPPPGDLPKPGIQPKSPTLQADSLPSKPLGKPKNTGVGSLSLLQGIFPAQESNRGLPHCKQIPYQLSYEGNPGTWHIQLFFR